jgi:hypothetical protein
MRYLFLGILLALVAGTSIWLPLPEQQVSGATTTNSAQQTPVVFVEVSSAQSKINWTHDNGRSEARHLPETCGGGGWGDPAKTSIVKATIEAICLAK